MRNFDVLVVDDRSIDADVTLLALRRAAPDAKVLRLKNGGEALSYLHAVGDFAARSREMPGLVLLDMDMPVVSGQCVLEIIRAHPATSAICVVMLCIDSHPHAFRRPARFAANAYLVKPVDLDRYCALIERTLRRWLPRVFKEDGQPDAEQSSPRAHPGASLVSLMPRLIASRSRAR